MFVDLPEDQWVAVGRGELTGPDARRYRRSTTRTRRRECDGLMADGVPLVLYYWAGGQLAWFDGDDAVVRWRDVRGQVTSETPRPRGEVVWTAGRWLDDEGRPLLLLTGYC